MAGLAVLLTLAVTPASGAVTRTIASHVSGDVIYQQSTDTAPHHIIASVIVAPDSFITTGEKSLAAIRFPDSSIVDVGSNSVVRIGEFHEDWHSAANVIVLKGGTIHLDVRHDGHPANYEFLTPLFTVAIRGTQATIATTDSEGSVTCQEGNVAVSVNNHTTNVVRGQTLTVGRSGENGFLEKLTGP